MIFFSLKRHSYEVELKRPGLNLFQAFPYNRIFCDDRLKFNEVIKSFRKALFQCEILSPTFFKLAFYEYFPYQINFNLLAIRHLIKPEILLLAVSV